MSPARNLAHGITGSEGCPPELDFGAAYVWTRLKLGYPVAGADQAVVDDLRERGLLPDGVE